MVGLAAERRRAHLAVERERDVGAGQGLERAPPVRHPADSQRSACPALRGAIQSPIVTGRLTTWSTPFGCGQNAVAGAPARARAIAGARSAHGPSGEPPNGGQDMAVGIGDEEQVRARLLLIIARDGLDGRAIAEFRRPP